MDEKQIKKQQAERLAADILNLSRNTLLVNLRFLDAALCKFVQSPMKITDTLATDGEHLYYDVAHVLRLYREGREVPVRDYLHVTLHCIFHHPFIHTLVDMELWGLACDIAVEHVINEIGLRDTDAPRAAAQYDIISNLQDEVKPLTAEKIYHYYLDQHLSEDEVKELRDYFMADDHDIWFVRGKSAKEGDGDADGSASRRAPDMSGNGSPNSADDSLLGAGLESDRDEIEKEWEQFSHRIQVDLDTASRDWAEQAGTLVQNLRQVTRQKYDYADFLRKFATLNEAMVVNDEEFDYIFYTYGLQLYENMPLIEPLEYQEIHQIREFVIAIDTSGSVSGELVQKFIEKTYNILKQEESFASKVNIHIIQCDAEVQDDFRLEDANDFQTYLDTMQLHGFGGTDFRPVFKYVDELIASKELLDLKGLIYFTDGKGHYPEQPPQYETAFVFLDDGTSNPIVPVWATKLMLQEDDLDNL